MKKVEELLWILDRPKNELGKAQKKMSREDYATWHRQWEDEKMKEKIDFSHSLGLKCDIVGWTRLDLGRPDAGEILDKIECFCKERNWFARGHYSVRYEDSEAEWYVLDRTRYANAYDKDIMVTDEAGEPMAIPAVKAYKLNGAILRYGDYQWVNERFRDACLRQAVKGIQFLWLRDIGKYAAKQYFALYPDASVFHTAHVHLEQNKKLEEKQRLDPKLPPQLKAFGGYLSRIAEIFPSIHFYFPPQFRASEMPMEGFAFLPNATTFNKARPALTLVHRDTAKMLVEEKVISESNLCAALLYDAVPAQYQEEERPAPRRPQRAVFEQMQQEYEELTTHPRPQRKASEKEAIKLLRRAKTQRKEDFAKRMKKEPCDSLLGSVFAPLVPYYMLADGGALSDEYELLSYKMASEATEEFQADMAGEGLLEETPKGIAFAVCGDGDKVVLKPDGAVARYSHEEPLACEEWPNLPQFFMECIEVD